MNKIRLSIAALLLAAISFFYGCKQERSATENSFDPEFGNYISAFTSGIVSSRDPIIIRFGPQIKITGFQPGDVIDIDLIKVSPKVKGDLYFEDHHTLRFMPEDLMKNGEHYQVRFDLFKLFDVSENIRVFEFGFKVVEQSVMVEIIGLSPYNMKDPKFYFLEGVMRTADFVSGEKVKDLISARQSGDPLNIRLQKVSQPNSYKFFADSIIRSEQESNVELIWDGEPIKADISGKKEVLVPALNSFEITDIRIVQQPEQYAVIRFSDAIKEDQNLKGIIRFVGRKDPEFSIETNTIKVFPEQRLQGAQTIKIDPGIFNVAGYKLEESYVRELSFEDIKPGVRLIGQGVIIPNSKGLIFPFEAVNLDAVDISVIKIYEDNVTQFLQNNRLDGNNQLKRVGRPVFRKKIPLNTGGTLDAGKWNAYFFDMADLIGEDPGAIYTVELSFKRSYSLFNCPGNTLEDVIPENTDENDEFDDSYWDNNYYYSYRYYRPPGFDWRERDNPCHISYYNSERWVSRNVLASNLGIIAKQTNQHKLHVAVTDLLTTLPLGNVKVEVHNYQQQLMEGGLTNANGFIEFELTNKPYLLIASNGDDKGYLRLDDGSSLSLSMFNVGGEVVQQGIKGFIYGERGVWRPGDTLFLNLILDDRQNKLPDNHPVVFELTNPQGQLINRMVKTAGINGFYSFTCTTKPDAQTGIWNISAKVGGSVFNKKIRIETVKPNRLKINFDYQREILSAEERNVQGKLSVKWLFGAVAKNLKARVMVTLNSRKTKFENFKEYVFDDYTKRYFPEEKIIFDKRIDENGEAWVKSDLGTYRNPPGMLTANFMVRAFEEGGDFSTDYFSIPYAPYRRFVGIRIPGTGNYRNEFVTDSSYRVGVVTVDKLGDPAESGELEVNIVKMRWRWWWDVSNENIGNYVQRHYQDIISTQTVKTINGKGSFDLKIDYPNWGRFLVQVKDPDGGHSASQIIYVDWPAWVSKENRGQPEGAKIMEVTTDKESYFTGEEAIVTFPVSGSGRALVSIENGSDILDAYWLEPESGSDEAEVRISLTESMSPNIYVHVTFIQPHAQTANDRFIRLYGVKSIAVEDRGTRLKPVISMDEALKPEREFKIKISEENNKPMTYTIAVVDDGLLDLTRYITPDPWLAFYAKEAIGVKTWDVYDYVLGAYGGKMEQLFATGGDEGELKKTEAKANRFKPVVMFQGPFELDGRSNTHILEMPRYVGSVRTMVIAGNKGAYGHAEKTSLVKNPLMVLGTLPRVLGPGERVKFPVTIFAMDEQIKNVKIKLKTNDLLSPQGADEISIRFDQTGEKNVNFELRVAEKTGVGKVSIVAGSGREQAIFDIELDIRNPNPPVSELYEVLIEPGKTWRKEYVPVGIEGTNEGLLEVSSIPPVDFGKRLKYLIRYPYGCSEQITSAAFPQLFLKDVMLLDNSQKDFAAKNVKYAIDQLIRLQDGQGGFNYWPGSANPHDWISSYIGHFMLEAEKRGFTISSGVKKKWIGHQKENAKRWVSYNHNSHRHRNYYQVIQAYRLYTLALAGSPDLSSMNRMRESDYLDKLAKWRLAAAYAMVGKPEVARDLIRDLDFQTDTPPSMNNSFGSILRDKAMILETLVILDERDKAGPLVLEISGKLSESYWYSTQTTAYCLIALAKYAGKVALTGKEMSFDCLVNNKKKTVSTKMPLSQFEIGFPNLDDGVVEITNNGKSVIYGRMFLQGKPVIGEETAAESKLKTEINYKTLDGDELDPSSLNQGTDFIAEVTIHNSTIYGDYRNMALSQIFPSGWEIINTRLGGYTPGQEVDRPDYRDVRDDRVYTHFDLGRKKKTFTVMLNAAYIGRFYLPAVICEAMYDNSVYARIPGKWVEVVRPGTND